MDSFRSLLNGIREGNIGRTIEAPAPIDSPFLSWQSYDDELRKRLRPDEILYTVVREGVEVPRLMFIYRGGPDSMINDGFGRYLQNSRFRVEYVALNEVADKIAISSQPQSAHCHRVYRNSLGRFTPRVVR